MLRASAKQLRRDLRQVEPPVLPGMYAGRFPRLDTHELRFELVDHGQPVRARCPSLPSPTRTASAPTCPGDLLGVSAVEEFTVLLANPTRAHYGEVAEGAEIVKSDIQR